MAKLDNYEIFLVGLPYRIFFKNRHSGSIFLSLDMKSGEFVDSKMLICRTTINLFVCYSISMSHSNSTCQ